MAGIFTSTECSCIKAPLTEYAILEYDNPEDTPADFIKRYGAWPDDRVESIAFKIKFGGVHIREYIRAFTIGEAFNYIAWLVDGSKEPKHRIMKKFDENGGIFREVHSCSLVLKPKEATQSEKEAMLAEIRARTKNLFGDLHA